MDEAVAARLRALPQVQRLLEVPAAQVLIGVSSRAAVADALRAVLDEARAGKVVHPLYLLWGEEYLVRKGADELVKALLPDASAGLNFAVLDAGSPREVAGGGVGGLRPAHRRSGAASACNSGSSTTSTGRSSRVRSTCAARPARRASATVGASSTARARWPSAAVMPSSASVPVSG